jgi:hypothetical protein
MILYNDTWEMFQALVCTLFLHDVAMSLSMIDNFSGYKPISRRRSCPLLRGISAVIEREDASTDLRTQQSGRWLGLLSHRISLLAIFIDFGLRLGGDVL